jgi:hypothetical protein
MQRELAELYAARAREKPPPSVREDGAALGHWAAAAGRASSAALSSSTD